MDKYLRADEKLARLVKPPIQQIESISFGKDDCLILCAGFEDRAIGGIKRLESRGGGGKVVVIDYLPEVKENKFQDIVDICNLSNLSQIHLKYDRQCPEGFGNFILDTIKDFGGRIYIDISGMSRILIVQLIDAMGRKESGFQNTSVIYTEAKFYPPDKSAVDELIKQQTSDPWFPVSFISSGVFDLHILPELTSIVMNDQPYRLIAFPSFNSYQLTTLRSELQFSNFTFIHGQPPNTDLDWRTESIRTLNSIENIPNKEEFSVSTFEYIDTLNLLLEIYDRVNIFEKVFIAPTGSKMQAVAIGIVRAFLNDIQIVYPTPKSFLSAEKYTEGVKSTFKLDLDTLSFD